MKKRRSDSTNDRTTLDHLRKLLDENQGGEDTAEPDNTPQSSDSAPNVAERDLAGTSSDDQLALEGVENPLQLLARASDLRIASPHTISTSVSTPGSRLAFIEPSTDVHRFFLPMKASLDQGPGLDPIDVGLVTLDEAETLLKYFHQKLAHTRWGLDPVVHTLGFVRSRSAFLFTTLLAMTANFLDEAASLAKRLLLHRRYLAEQVVVRKCRSVEIVLGFMVSIPW